METMSTLSDLGLGSMFWAIFDLYLEAAFAYWVWVTDAAASCADSHPAAGGTPMPATGGTGTRLRQGQPSLANAKAESRDGQTGGQHPEFFLGSLD